jgi:small subunit ribosomal protein S17
MADETEETEATTKDVAGAASEAAPAEAAPAAAADPAAEAPAAAAAPAPSAAIKVAEPSAEDGTRPNRRKVREGVVVSDAMQATVVVAVVERVRHPRYGKTVQRTKKLYVHDAEDTAKVGDRVRVQETRPLSKLKRWRLTEVVERAR